MDPPGSSRSTHFTCGAASLHACMALYAVERRRPPHALGVGSRCLLRALASGLRADVEVRGT